MTVPYTRMAASALASLTVVGLAAAVPFWADERPASAAARYHDAAYGIAASGAAPISARPSVSSSNGSLHTGGGGVQSSDGTIKVSSSSVSAGDGQASAQVSGFSAFDGLVSASSVTATCSNGKVSSSASGTSGALGAKGSVVYDVHLSNSDGSTTVIGMQVHVAAGKGTEAATISVAAATCAKADDSETTSKPTGRPTSKPTHSPSPTRTATAAPTRSSTDVPSSTPPLIPSLGTTQGSMTDQPRHEGEQDWTPDAPAPTPHTTHAAVTG